MIGDLEAVEPRIALVVQIEEGIQHGEVERLPEPPRTGEKENTATIGVDDVGDEHGLVHIAHIFFTDAPEGLPADIDLPHVRRMVRRRKNTCYEPSGCILRYGKRLSSDSRIHHP